MTQVGRQCCRFGMMQDGLRLPSVAFPRAGPAPHPLSWPCPPHSVPALPPTHLGSHVAGVLHEALRHQPPGIRQLAGEDLVELVWQRQTGAGGVTSAEEDLTELVSSGRGKQGQGEWHQQTAGPSSFLLLARQADRPAPSPTNLVLLLLLRLLGLGIRLMQLHLQVRR